MEILSQQCSLQKLFKCCVSFAECIRNYFCKFFECNIQPIIVFDGGHDKSERKLKTICKRMKERLLSVSKIAQHEKISKQVLPILAKDVFISVLDELNVPFAVSDYEADDQITVLANYYKCPVISADSDFFISDVHNGFILLDSLETRVTIVTDSDGNEFKHLDCYIYSFDEFLSNFPGVQKTVLPLFGTLMGNDYVNPCIFEDFFISIQLPYHNKIRSLLHWLKGKSLNDAMAQIFEYLSHGNQEHVKYIVENAIANYNLYNCELKHIINLKLNYTKWEILIESRLITPCGNPLPIDFIMKFHRGHYFSYFANVIVLHKHFLVPQIDDLDFDSSYACSRYIRRVIYGILTRHDVDGKSCKYEKCLAPVEEYDRHETTFEKELVEPIFMVEEIGMLPKINELRTLETKKAKSILMNVLGVDVSFFTNIPSEWQLLFGCINYWLCNSFPHCSEAFLYALIINFIYYEVIECYSLKYLNNKVLKCFCASAKLNYKCPSMIHMLSNINQKELKQVKINLEKYFSNPLFNRFNPFCVNIVHCYSQLQGCLKSAISLNKLLGTCMKNPNIHRCFNGSLLYNLTKDISMQDNPKLFVTGILGKGTTFSELFTLINSKVCHDVSSSCILKNKPPCKSKKSVTTPNTFY